MLENYLIFSGGPAKPVAEPGWLIEGGFVRCRNLAGIFRKSISRSQGGVQSRRRSSSGIRRSLGSRRQAALPLRYWLLRLSGLHSPPGRYGRCTISGLVCRMSGEKI